MQGVASSASTQTYVDDVFSTYLYTGTGAARTINTGISLEFGFTAPALINGSTVVAYMRGVAVNSAGVIVAVGYNSSTQPLYSTATTVSTLPTPALMNGSTAVGHMNAVAVNSAGLFVAVGYTVVAGVPFSTVPPVYATSSDGYTWISPALMNGSTVDGEMLSIAVNSSGVFVAIGVNPSTRPIFSRSTNGSTWTTPAQISGSYCYLQSITVNSAGLFVAVGTSGTSRPNYTTSSDGSTWSALSEISSSTTTSLTAVTVNSAGLFVAVGYDTPSYTAKYTTSTNGTTWTTMAVMSSVATYAIMTSITVDSSGLFVAVGYNASNQSIFSTSSNGTTWTVPALMNGSAINSSPKCVAVTKTGSFISVGYNTSNQPMFAYSVTGGTGMIWIKDRTLGTRGHVIFDTVRGGDYFLTPSGGSSGLLAGNDASRYGSGSTQVNFTSYGFSLNTDTAWSSTNYYTTSNYVAWTFKKAPKFFDIVTWTADGNSRTITHQLGTIPGLIIVKQTDGTEYWNVSHIDFGTYQYLWLNTDNAKRTRDGTYGFGTKTSTTVNLGNGYEFSQPGKSYIAYLFAHDPSPTGMIRCGSYTGNGSTIGPTVNLGWEPQWLLLKNTGASAGAWVVVDNNRGIAASTNTNNTGTQYLYPNGPNAEFASTTSVGVASITSTGFQLNGATVVNYNGESHIYMAIRRPTKPPTLGTQVFSPVIANTLTFETAGFPVDMVMNQRRDAGSTVVTDRLRNAGLGTYTSSSESSMGGSMPSTGYWDNMTGYTGYFHSPGAPSIYWNFKRAPGFFDVVCYTGNDSDQSLSHNLGVKPQLIFTKSRTAAPYSDWYVYSETTSAYTHLILNSTAAVSGFDGGTWWSYVEPTTSIFHVNYATGRTGHNYVAYLFATLAGISKVGSYTGNGGTSGSAGTSQTINCGFAAGARFILIKCTSAVGDWYVWDTARGIVAATDPHLSLNTTAAEVTTDDSIDPANSGFIVNQVAATNINVTSATYIFLAIA